MVHNGCRALTNTASAPKLPVNCRSSYLGFRLRTGNHQRRAHVCLIPAQGRNRMQARVARGVAAVTVALAVGMVASSLTFTVPARAAQEVYRTHPCKIYNNVVYCSQLRDQWVTLVKYYDGSRYQVCVANYHHTGEIQAGSWLAEVSWYDNNHNFVNAWWNPEPIYQPGPGGLQCTPFRPYHAKPVISYSTALYDWFWSELYPIK